MKSTKKTLTRPRRPRGASEVQHVWAQELGYAADLGASTKLQSIFGQTLEIYPLVNIYITMENHHF